jgi:hypothetical protein
MSARIRTEFGITLPHRPGELARVLEAMSKAGANVLGFCGWGGDGSARVLLVADDDRKARKALADGGFQAVESQVVCVTGASGKGAGAKLTLRLAKASANIEHAFATTTGGGESTAVFKVPDPQAALALLQ